MSKEGLKENIKESIKEEVIVCPNCEGKMTKTGREKTCPDCDWFICEDCLFEDNYQSVAIEEALKIDGFIQDMMKKTNQSAGVVKRLIREIVEE